MKFQIKGLDCEIIGINPHEGKGGQHVTKSFPDVKVTCENFGLEFKIGCHRSQIANKELAILLLELAIEDVYQD